MNPREFFREPGYEKALLLSYSFDPIFFESVVLTDLWAGRASEVLVCVDRGQMDASISSAGSQARHLGKRYLVASAGHAGAFHPKVYLRLGRESGLVMVGSGNLTSAGWGGNEELATAWRVGPAQEDEGGWISLLLEDVAHWCEGEFERETISRLRALSWLPEIATVPGPDSRLLYSRANSSLGSQVARRWAGRTFSEVSVLTGSTDEGGAFLRWAHRIFGISKATVALTPQCASFRPEQLADLPLDLRIVVADPAKRLHAKACWFDGPDGAAALMGSANCSAAAWLLAPDGGGNVESIVVYDHPDRADFTSLWDVLDRPAQMPGEALHPLPSKPQAALHDAPAYRIVEVLWDSDLGIFSLGVKPGLASPGSIVLICEREEIQMHPADEAFTHWRSRPQALAGAPATTVVSARIEVGGKRWMTPLHWINDVTQLQRSMRSSRDVNPIRDMDFSGTLSEQRKVLEQLNEVARYLVSDYGHYVDPGRNRRVAENRQEEEPAKAVDPDALIYEIGKESVYGGSSGGSNMSLSLSGITALFFYDEFETEDPSEFTDEDDSPKQKPSRQKPKAREQGAIDPKFKKKLCQQVESFIDKIYDDEFATRCTATQMVQAVTYPLAIAHRGRPQGWVDDEDGEQWALWIFALLFREDFSGEDGLLRAVERRYRNQGESTVFEDVVGDGTLWLVLVATLFSARWNEDGGEFERALAIREVFSMPQLISSAVPGRISSLVKKMRVEDAKSMLERHAPRVCESLLAIEERIESAWDTLIDRQSKANVSFQVGDVLWRRSGWAVCIEGIVATSPQTNVRARFRGRDTKVRSSFYINVSEAARCSDEISELLAAVREALDSMEGDAAPCAS
jgi:hypothetical protein